MPATHPTHNYDENAPHQAAIEVLVLELESALDEAGCGYTEDQIQAIEATIDLLCGLRDGTMVAAPALGPSREDRIVEAMKGRARSEVLRVASDRMSAHGDDPSRRSSTR